MEEMNLALKCTDVTVHYGTCPVLWDISMSIPSGIVVGILGPNGAGKSTLVKAALGMIPISSGEILLGGMKIEDIRRNVAHVPQRESVDWSFPITVRELVKMGCYPKRGLFRSLLPEDIADVEWALDLLGLKSVSETYVTHLSGGQQQRAFLARALVQKADIYFLDEPFSGVDHTSEQIIVDTLKAMALEGKTIFVVHHDLMTVEQYFDWLVVLNTRLVDVGPTKRVFTLDTIRSAYGTTLSLVEEMLKLSSTVRGGGS